jgi:hypothetical protein
MPVMGGGDEAGWSWRQVHHDVPRDDRTRLRRAVFPEDRISVFLAYRRFQACRVACRRRAFGGPGGTLRVRVRLRRQDHRTWFIRTSIVALTFFAVFENSWFFRCLDTGGFILSNN